jgi:AcrR family transcriptional regulator
MTRRTQAERRSATIRTLLDAATETLIEVGYAEASVQRICARTELSQGALFRHFATRDALMVRVAEDVGARLLERYSKKFRTLPQGDIPAAMLLVREACRSRLNQAWYELAIGARTNPTLRKALAPIARRYHTDISKLSRELLPDLSARLGPAFDALVATVLAMFDGETMHRFIAKEPALEDACFNLLAAAVSAAAQ